METDLRKIVLYVVLVEIEKFSSSGFRLEKGSVAVSVREDQNIDGFRLSLLIFAYTFTSGCAIPVQVTTLILGLNTILHNNSY